MRKLSLYISNILTRKRKRLNNPPNSDAIGILLYNPDFRNNQTINAFIKELEDSGREVQIICFLDKEVNRLYDFKYIELRMKDINVVGRFSDERINKFIKTGFGYLYSINNSPFLPFEKILRKSPAAVRIGKYFPGSAKYLDIMIHPPANSNLIDLISKMKALTPKIKIS